MKRPCGRVPIFLEGVDTNFAFFWNIRMENLGNKIPFGRIIREIMFYCELAPEDATLVGGTDWSFNISLNIRGITLINNHVNTYMMEYVPDGPLFTHSWVCLASTMIILGLSPCWIIHFVTIMSYKMLLFYRAQLLVYRI